MAEKVLIAKSKDGADTHLVLAALGTGFATVSLSDKTKSVQFLQPDALSGAMEIPAADFIAQFGAELPAALTEMLTPKEKAQEFSDEQCVCKGCGLRILKKMAQPLEPCSACGSDTELVSFYVKSGLPIPQPVDVGMSPDAIKSAAATSKFMWTPSERVKMGNFLKIPKDKALSHLAGVLGSAAAAEFLYRSIKTVNG